MGALSKRVTRLLAVSVLTLLVGVPAMHAQSANATNSNRPDRDIQLLREDEDWSFLKDPSLRKDFWDHLKFIPLRSNGDWYITISGEAREM